MDQPDLLSYVLISLLSVVLRSSPLLFLHMHDNPSLYCQLSDIPDPLLGTIDMYSLILNTRDMFLIRLSLLLGDDLWPFMFHSQAEVEDGSDIGDPRLDSRLWISSTSMHRMLTW